MLDLAKIEAGRFDLAVEPFALASFIEDSVELLGPRAQAKGLEICGYVDERLPSRVLGDTTRLRQVRFNLAGNAIKFTESGGVSILVEPAAETDQVAIAVHRYCRRRSRPHLPGIGGIGLGLTISKRIVERMGGTIDVASAPGPGSTCCDSASASSTALRS